MSDSLKTGGSGVEGGSISAPGFLDFRFDSFHVSVVGSSRSGFSHHFEGTCTVEEYYTRNN